MDILLMNASGSSSRHATERKAEICKIIEKVKPKVVLFQEFKWKYLRGNNWGTNGLPDNYSLLGNTEAAIVFDAKNIDVEEIPAKLIDDILLSKKHFPTNFNPRPRMCVCLIGTCNKSHKGLRFICLSWHGQHRGLKQEEKKLHLQCLLEFVSEIGKKYDIPIMIGGDFNIEIDKVSDIIEENGNFKMVNYTPSQRRSRGVIDYFIKSKSSVFQVYDTNYLVLPTEAIDLFDHDPLICKIHYDIDIQVWKIILYIINSRSICENDSPLVFVGKHCWSSSSSVSLSLLPVFWRSPSLPFWSCSSSSSHSSSCSSSSSHSSSCSSSSSYSSSCSSLSSYSWLSRRLSEPFVKKIIYDEHCKVVIVQIYDEIYYDYPYYVVYIYNSQKSYRWFWDDLLVGDKYAASKIMSHIKYLWK